MPHAWDFIDALTFESVGDAGSDGVELSKIMGSIDYVDRIVLNHAEMEQTLQRLLGSGLVEETTVGFRRTAVGQVVHANCPGRFAFGRARWVESYLTDLISCRPATDWSRFPPSTSARH